MVRTAREPKKKEEDEVLYCLCRKPDDGDFMIGCDFCNEWYHGKCVNITRKQAVDIKRYSCPRCQPKHPIVYAPKRQDDHDDYSSQDEDESEEEEDTFPIKRKLSNTPQEPRKLPKKEGLRGSQEVSKPPVRVEQKPPARFIMDNKQKDREIKRNEQDEYRKKSRSILLDSLQQGIKQDKANIAASAAAQKEVLDDPNLSDEVKAEKVKALQEETPEFKFIVLPTALANEIESELFKQLYLVEIGSWKDYNARLRSLAFNLKDPKNPLLRGRLLSKELAPSQLPSMSSTDLANRDLTIMRQKIAEQAVKNVTIDTKEVESALQMEKKWRGGGKTKSEYSSAEDILPTEINTSLPRPASPSHSTGEDGEGKTEEYAQEDAGVVDTLPEDTYAEEGAGEEGGEDGGAEEDNLQLDLQGLASSSVPALETKPSLPLPLPPKVIWEGTLDMSTMNEMPSAGYLKKKCRTRALYVSGPDTKDITIEPSMPVKGKISIPKLFGYLAQIEASPSRAVTVASIEAVGDDDTVVYKTAYNYFMEQQRAAVFSVRSGTGQLPSLEEVYVTPVPENIPHDFPSLLRPPFRGAVSINGKLLAVFIMRTAPASTPYGKSSSPSRRDRKSHSHSHRPSPTSSSSSHSTKTSPPRKDPRREATSPPAELPPMQSPPQISPSQQQQIAQLQQLQQQLQQQQQQQQQMQQVQQGGGGGDPRGDGGETHIGPFGLNAELLASLVKLTENNNINNNVNNMNTMNNNMNNNFNNLDNLNNMNNLNNNMMFPPNGNFNNMMDQGNMGGYPNINNQYYK